MDTSRTPLPAGRVLPGHAVLRIAGLALLATLLVTGGLIWLVLATGKPGESPAAGILDAVKIGLSVGAGGGGIFALYLAWRRQQSTDEANAQQLAAAADTRYDATERRVTELYTKAVEQFGASNLAIQLGGLYALERLAQDHPGQRRPVVNLLCAYLRTRFDTDQCELRKAVGQVLRDHAHTALDEPTGAAWWDDDLTVDLTGATLVEVNLGRLRLHPTTRFPGATFLGDVEFGGSVFTGPATFTGATFKDKARFSGVSFTDLARFHGATFAGNAWFDGATCTGDAWFSEATFAEGAWFSRVSFHGRAEFHQARLGRVARFDGASFAGSTGLHEATFGGVVDFGMASFATATALGTFTLDDPGQRHHWPTGWALESAAEPGSYLLVRDG